MTNSNYISQKLQENFERFLMGEMTTEEKLDFENELVNNSKLKTQFEDFKNIFSVIEETALKTELNTYHKDLPTTTKVKFNQNKKYNLLIAASVTSFILLGGFWFLNKQPKNEKIFATYFSPDPGLPTVMGNSNNYAFYEAMVDYKQAKYKQAILKWELLLKAKPNNDTLNYFLGVSHLAIKEFGIASKYLDEVSTLEPSVFFSDANLYYGLIHLKKNDIKKAKESLIKSDSETAKIILKDLK